MFGPRFISANGFKENICVTKKTSLLVVCCLVVEGLCHCYSALYMVKCTLILLIYAFRCAECSCNSLYCIAVACCCYLIGIS